MHKRTAFAAVLAAACMAAMPLAVSADPEETAAPAETTLSQETAAPPPPETTSSAAATTTTSTTTTTTTTTTSTSTTRNVLDALTTEALPDGTLRIVTFQWLNESVVTIPAQIDGKDVTEIGQSAFRYCYADEVILPATLRKIGDQAFEGNAYLQRVTIPEGCESIGYRAFSECDVLTEVNIPESVSYIGYCAFDSTPFYLNDPNDFMVLGGGVLYAYSGNAAEVTIPDNVKVIGPYALCDHSEITSVTIPDSVTAIWDCAFDNCQNLRTFHAPATFEYVDGAAFVNTGFYNEASGDFLTLGDYLLVYTGKGTEVHVPDGIRVVNDSAFEGNTFITTIYLPDTVERVGRAACYRCTSLQVVTLGDNVQKIGDLAFYGCETLRYLRVGHQLTSIGDYAFAGCKDLSAVYLPDTLETVGSGAFGYVYDLETNQYKKMGSALTIYSNTEAAKAYAEAEGIPIEPLPEAENTEPIPDVTTLAPEEKAGFPGGTAWIPAGIAGGVLVLIGAITFAVRRKKKQ